MHVSRLKGDETVRQGAGAVTVARTEDANALAMPRALGGSLFCAERSATA